MGQTNDVLWFSFLDGECAGSWPRNQSYPLCRAVARSWKVRSIYNDEEKGRLSNNKCSKGGANHPLQLAAIPLLDPDVYRKEAKYLQKHFRAKRDFVLQRLEEIGLKVRVPPVATFYVWLDLSGLPSPINIGLTFFEECLREKV